MILCKRKKVALLLNPKTGSSSLVNMFSYTDVSYVRHTHWTYDEATVFLDGPTIYINDLQNYKFFVFYRDPIERFLSSARFNISRWKYANYLLRSGPLKPELDLSTLDDPPVLEEEEVGYTWTDLFPDDVKNFLETCDTLHYDPSWAYLHFKKQISWFNVPSDDITYLSFRDFDSSLRTLFDAFDVPSKNIAEKSNVSDKSLYSLSKKQRIIVEEMYSDDYEFLSARNLL
jgi:hypothetical protein